MANNYTQATVSPELPAALFEENELQSLEYACGLTCEKIGDDLYFFSEEMFRENGEDPDDQDVDCLALLQEKLRSLDPAAYPHITIHGAETCGKMRPDEFGGFAHLITRDGVRSISTWQWLREQTEAARTLPLPAPPVEPLATRLLSALEAILPHAENESHSLYECWRRDGDPQITASSDTCAGAVTLAHAVAAEAKAARMPMETPAADLPARFDGYEIHGISKFDEDGRSFSEQVPDDEAQFWSLFGHIPDRGLECIGDFETRALAEEIHARITGFRFERQS